MGMDDKIRNEGQNMKGKIKEAAGKATNDRDMQAEGQTDQAAAEAKKLAEKAKDALR
jgi:uncharacterized protein YjbJ (UPF0337 family)